MYRLKFYSVTHNEKEVINRETSVTLLYEEKELATVTVVRYFKDLDIPVLGQKLAVEKLLQEPQFTREQRTEIWETFWNYSLKADSLRHGAYKKEIKYIKQEDQWRKWSEKLNRK